MKFNIIRLLLLILMTIIIDFTFLNHKFLFLPCEPFANNYSCELNCYYGYCSGANCCTYPGGTGGFRCVDGCCQDIDNY